MRYWPVGDFYDNTTRVLDDPDCVSGFETWEEADAVIQKILTRQRKPHHVTYRVESAIGLAELQMRGVLV